MFDTVGIDVVSINTETCFVPLCKYCYYNPKNSTIN